MHVFARRGPAYAKFSPMELRELNHSPNVEVIVHPEGFDVDDHGMEHIGKHKAQKMVLDTLANWVGREPVGKPHRIHLHFAEAAGRDRSVTATASTTLRTERTRPVGDGSVEGTGQVTDWDVQAVYRAVGYRSTPLPGLPFDDRAAVIPNDGGRVLDLDGDPIPGTYVTGWIKRGPVGLIGHTKSDAAETVGHLLAETDADRRARASPADVDAYLAERGVDVATFDHWERLDQHEIALGAAEGRERVKVATGRDAAPPVRSTDPLRRSSLHMWMPPSGRVSSLRHRSHRLPRRLRRRRADTRGLGPVRRCPHRFHDVRSAPRGHRARYV